MLSFSFRRNLPQFIAMAVFGLVLAGVLATFVFRAEHVKERARFEQAAQQRVSDARQHLDAALADLVALRALFNSVGTINRRQFDDFCAPLLAKNAAIQALEWIPEVSGDARAGFEEAARRDGFDDFTFKSIGPHGMAVEPTRSQYFHVYYVAPLAGNEKALGFDLASNPARRAALRRAAATGGMIATARIVLVQSVDGGYGFLVFYPVFGPSVEHAPASLRGFVLGVFKVRNLIAPTLQAVAAPPRGALKLAAFDITEHAAGHPDAVLYPKGFSLDPVALRSHDLVDARTTTVGGRQWEFIAYQQPSQAPVIEATLVFLVVLLGTGLVLALMRQTMIRRESEAQRAVAERSDASKSQFLANVSHEIRTPLNGVVGMLDLLLQSSLLPAQARMAEVSRRSAVALLSIINDLLDFSKMEAGKLQIAQEHVDVEEVVRDAVELFKHVAEKSNCHLRYFVDPHIPLVIVADPIRLRQIVTNLTSNAIKFSGGRATPGHVSVRARAAHADGIGGVLELGVEDDGIGIEASSLARLFQPFEQADPGTTKRYGGTGLGLTITHHLVALMGGEIRVESQPGAGSNFTVRLPMRAPNPEMDHRDNALAGLACRVLGADAECRERVEAYLEAAGARLAGSVPGTDAVDIEVECEEPVGPLGARQALVVRKALPAGLFAGEARLDRDCIPRKELLAAVRRVADGQPCDAPEASSMPGMDPAGFLTTETGVSSAPTVLVAEDNETNREVIRLQLARCGVRADMARDGREGLEMFRSGNYRLVLTDLHMPDMDGFELVRAIRVFEAAQGRAPATVLAVTAAAQDVELQRAVDAGMDGHLTKPIRLQALQEALTAWLAPQPEPGTVPAPSGAPLDPAPSPPPDPARAPIDVAVLQGFVGDDAVTIDALLAHFRGELDSIAGAIEHAAQAGDWHGVGALAHKLKSSARTVGALDLGDLCANMEATGRVGEGADAGLSLLGAFRRERARVRAALEQIVGDEPR